MMLYLSGPINSPIPGLTPEQCRANFFKAAQISREYWGYDVDIINPLAVPVQCREPRPQTSKDCGGPFQGHQYRCWMRGDLKALLECEAILMLPGWTQSRGANLEFRVAQDMEFDLYFMAQDMGGILQ